MAVFFPAGIPPLTAAEQNNKARYLAVFQGHSAHAMAEGLPLWTNFFLAVIDTVPEEMSKQIRASKPRVEKYLKKYHR